MAQPAPLPAAYSLDNKALRSWSDVKRFGAIVRTAVAKAALGAPEFLRRRFDMSATRAFRGACVL